MVLPEATRLRALVPEVRGRVPDLPWSGRTMLDVGAGDRRGAFGPERKVSIPLVEEVVHLLANNVGAFAHSVEHTDFFEHRALDESVSGATDLRGEVGDEALPAGRFGRQDVAGSHRGLEGFNSGA